VTQALINSQTAKMMTSQHTQMKLSEATCFS